MVVSIMLKVLRICSNKSSVDMAYSINYTNRFKKDLKRCMKRGLDIRKIQLAVSILEKNWRSDLQNIGLIN